jgi:hypothetical protein
MHAGKETCSRRNTAPRHGWSTQHTSAQESQQLSSPQARVLPIGTHATAHHTCRMQLSRQGSKMKPKVSALLPPHPPRNTRVHTASDARQRHYSTNREKAPFFAQDRKARGVSLARCVRLSKPRTPFQDPSSWPQKAGISRTRTVLQLTRQYHAPRCNSVLSTRPCAGPRPYDLPIPSIMLAATWQPSVAAVAGNLTSIPPPNQAEDHPPHTTCTGQTGMQGQAVQPRPQQDTH